MQACTRMHHRSCFFQPLGRWSQAAYKRFLVARDCSCSFNGIIKCLHSFSTSQMNNFKGNSFQTESQWDQADSVREQNRKNPWRHWSRDVESKRRMRVYDSLKNLLRATGIIIHKPRPCLRPWWKQNPGALCSITVTLHIRDSNLLHLQN